MMMTSSKCRPRNSAADFGSPYHPTRSVRRVCNRSYRRVAPSAIYQMCLARFGRIFGCSEVGGDAFVSLCAIDLGWVPRLDGRGASAQMPL